MATDAFAAVVSPSFNELLRELNGQLEATRETLSRLAACHVSELQRPTASEARTDSDLVQAKTISLSSPCSDSSRKQVPREEWLVDNKFESASDLESDLDDSIVTMQFTNTEKGIDTQGAPTCILHPKSKRRLAWDLLGMFFITFDIITLPLLAFDIHTVGGKLFEWFVSVYWTMDIFVTLRTGYYRGPTLIMTPTKIIKNYVQGWMFMDVAVVTTDWAVRILTSVDGLNAARLYRFRVLRIPRMLRSLKMPSFMARFESELTSTNLLLCVGGAKITICLCLVVHLFACMWHFLGSLSQEGWVHKEGLVSADFVKLYMQSARWTLAQINGRTDQESGRTVLEMAFTCACATFTIVFMSFFISAVTTIFMEIHQEYSVASKYTNVFKRYRERRSISRRVVFFAKEHIKSRQQIQIDQEEEQCVMDLLPKQLKSDLLYEVRAPILLHHPFFHELRTSSRSRAGFREICSHATKTVRNVRAEIVFVKRETCNRMLFVEAGSLHYKHNGTYKQAMAGFAFGADQNTLMNKTSSLQSLIHEVSGAKELKPVTWLCEPALWIHWKTCGELLSLTYTTLLAIEAKQFVEAVKHFPTLFVTCAAYAREVYDNADNLRSDLQDVKNITAHEPTIPRSEPEPAVPETSDGSVFADKNSRLSEAVASEAFQQSSSPRVMFTSETLSCSEDVIGGTVSKNLDEAKMDAKDVVQDQNSDTSNDASKWKL
eukprot:TRINITY_DN4572_c0_g1_i1.p1 TRINITY_DN4572_c0_g1~~TRINITY_DN4572_c0_g1_i1.p1  ORF type:complete len:716 (+),score=98.55 TRINITY_DN4572_c0_g1_i1:81-2228(+)